MRAQGAAVKVCPATADPSSVSEYSAPAARGPGSFNSIGPCASAAASSSPRGPRSAARPLCAETRTTWRFQGASPPAGGNWSVAVGGGATAWKAKRAPFPARRRPSSSLSRGETSRKYPPGARAWSGTSEIDRRSAATSAAAGNSSVRSCAESGACSMAAAARSTSASSASTTLSLRPEAARSWPSSIEDEKRTVNLASACTDPGCGSTSCTVGCDVPASGRASTADGFAQAMRAIAMHAHFIATPMRKRPLPGPRRRGTSR